MSTLALAAAVRAARNPLLAAALSLREARVRVTRATACHHGAGFRLGASDEAAVGEPPASQWITLTPSRLLRAEVP